MSEALLVGLAAYYVWYLICQADIFDKPLAWPREHWSPLIGCPWCLGFWVTGLILLLTHSYDPVTHLAASGVAGLAGSHSG